MLPLMTIEAPNLMKAAQVIGAGAKHFSDWRPAWQQLAPFMAEGLQENITSAGASLGKRFPELAAGTLAVRKRLGLGGDILVGRHRDMLELAGARHRITKSSLRVAASRERYPYVQHFGSTRAGRSNRTTIPARPWIGISTAMKTLAITVMNTHAKVMLEAFARELRSIAGG